MWYICIILYIVLAVFYTRFYKIATESSSDDVTLTLLVPTLFIGITEKISFKRIKKEFVNGDKVAIVFTSLCWGVASVFQLRTYQLGNVTTVAPLCALTVIGNVLVGYIFLNERDGLFKKIIAAILIIISVFLIKA